MPVYIAELLGAIPMEPPICCSHAELWLRSWLRPEQLMGPDRDRLVLAWLAILKYVHVLLCATQCVSVKCTELRLWSDGDIFHLWSLERQGWVAAIKMQCVAHCWVPVWQRSEEGLPGRTLRSLLPWFNLVNTGYPWTVSTVSNYKSSRLESGVDITQLTHVLQVCLV